MQRASADTTPSSTRIEAVRALQRRVGNRATRQLVDSAGAPEASDRLPPSRFPGAHSPAEPVRRVIRTPTSTFGANRVRQADPLPVQAALRDANAYLLRTDEDLIAVLSQGRRDVPMLPPTKHLIGEQHDASRFAEAVAMWGWGAQAMREDLSANARMPHVAGEENRKRAGSAAFGALPLEDTIAKDLTIAIKAHRFMRMYAESAEAVERRFSELDRPLPTPGRPIPFGDTKRDVLRGVLREHAQFIAGTPGATDMSAVVADLRAYVSAAPGAFRQWRGEAAWPGVESLGATLKDAAVLPTLDAAAAGLVRQAADGGVDDIYFATAQRLTAGAVAIDRLITELRTLLASPGSAFPERDVAASVDEAKRSGIEPMNVIREHYMAESIRSRLGVPGLVKLGAAHATRVAALAGAGALAYPNFDAFLAATTAQQVLGPAPAPAAGNGAAQTAQQATAAASNDG